jgi:hypothetical protein
VSLAVLLAVIVLGVVLTVVVGKAQLRIAVAAVVIAAALWLWDQRASIDDCIHRLRESAAQSSTETCRAFGLDLRA